MSSAQDLEWCPTCKEHRPAMHGPRPGQSGAYTPRLLERLQDRLRKHRWPAGELRATVVWESVTTLEVNATVRLAFQEGWSAAMEVADAIIRSERAADSLRRS